MSKESVSESTCPVCVSKNISGIIEIPQVPVHCNLLWSTRDEALRAPTGDIHIGCCKDCGHIFNLTFDPSLMKYTKDYENSLYFSPRFKSYADTLATHLINRYDLRNKEIIEIGCGNGDFLTLLCKLGGNRGFGFDPGYVHKPNNGADTGNITFIQDFYSERYAAYKADIICCRHVLEHIRFPRDFLDNLRRAIGNRHNTIVFFEVPNALFILRDLSIWDIIYEHCSYFNSLSLARLFASCGFSVNDVTESFEGQFLCIEAMPGEVAGHFSLERLNTLNTIMRYAAEFSSTHQKRIDEWKYKLERFKYSGKRIVVWGAGSKGVTFLNAIKPKNQIHYIVDINPRKQNMFVAGTAQQIVPPVFLQDYRPDIILIMNPLYRDEISMLASNMNLTAELVLV